MLNLISLENLRRLVRNHHTDDGGNFWSSQGRRCWRGRGTSLPPPLTPLSREKHFVLR